ncbi:hypothetical protein PGT21_018874 [Puccinia graminis f. sp. tritici]|uniref:Uncharacterized protein n=1 Tax=Puccinia graminis f. sp. tritici TaxID=56615 RepID=A0A5B0QN27_PUCGR|nr:hypothetical protein PGT21_018874 [Puccinia graminis f. sp. tritici]
MLGFQIYVPSRTAAEKERQSPEPGSNQRPQDRLVSYPLQSRALPTELSGGGHDVRPLFGSYIPSHKPILVPSVCSNGANGAAMVSEKRNCADGVFVTESSVFLSHPAPMPDAESGEPAAPRLRPCRGSRGVSRGREGCVVEEHTVTTERCHASRLS